MRVGRNGVKVALAVLLLALVLAQSFVVLARPLMDGGEGYVMDGGGSSSSTSSGSNKAGGGSSISISGYTYTPDPNLYLGGGSQPARGGQTFVFRKEDITWYTEASGTQTVPPPSGELDPSNTQVYVWARDWKGNPVPITYSLDLFDKNGNIVIRGTTRPGAEVIVNVIHMEKPSQTQQQPTTVTLGGGGGGGGGGNPSDGDYTPTSVTISVPSASLTVQLYRVDAGGNSLGPAAGAQVRVGGTTYTADSQGRVSVQVQQGSTVSVEVLQTTLSSGWQRYTFWRWGDGSTSNPRSFTVSSSSTATAYVWDERLLKVTWSPDAAGRVNVNGQPVSNGWSNWYRYGTQLTLQAVPTSGALRKWQRGTNGGQLVDYSTSNPVTVTVDNGYHFNALFDLIITLQLGTMYLPGEGIATPWLADVSNWAWNGTWWLNVTEPYPVSEHLVAILMNSSGGVEVLPLPNGTSLGIQLPERWRQSPPVIERGGMKIVQLNFREALPTVKVDGRELYFVALAAWDPYKQGYDTSCWLGNGTTLAVYNLTFTYSFENGIRVVFKEPVVVSTLKTTVTPVYSIGELKQGLSLKVTASWKYLPPARTGIQPSQPSSIVGVVVIGNKVYEGALIDADSTSKTFLVSITNDTWTLYAQGVTSITASAYWLSSMGTPEGPVAMQEPAQLNIVYVMPHIDAISEGSSLTATISIFDVRTDQRYSGYIYIELRDNRTYAVVWRDSGLEFVPGQKTITRSIPNTKQYVLAIYALPIPQKDKLVVPIPAVYPPRA
jgi:hypothetical protein